MFQTEIITLNNGSLKKAQKYYKRAILSAKQRNLTQRLGLIYELYAQSRIKAGKTEKGKLLLSEAFIYFLDWGAKAKLNQLKEKYEMIGDVRGQGLMAAIEMVDDRKTRKPSNKDRVSSVFNSICKAGVLIRASGNNFIISLLVIAVSSNKFASPS